MSDPVLSVVPLGFPWPTPDPFLFCAHHLDAYPAGNGRLGPAGSLAGRDLGNDFSGKQGWRMYHGETIPGFPQHPHRGFETVTIALSGFIDHSDSLGAAARFGPGQGGRGRGDVQWVTAGKGILHSEMFPLVETGRPNPVELFQIWLNLPAADKLAEPHFTMLWSESIPVRAERDPEGRRTEISVIAGRSGDAAAPPPPPRSWAARPEAEVAIWTLRMEPHAEWELPAASPGPNRMLYFHRGGTLRIGTRELRSGQGALLKADRPALLRNGAETADMLMLQGRPIGEPVVQYGPFVMNSRAEIEAAFQEYQRTEFGGWPWPGDDPAHAAGEGRFARHADGRVERPG